MSEWTAKLSESRKWERGRSVIMAQGQMPGADLNTHTMQPFPADGQVWRQGGTAGGSTAAAARMGMWQALGGAGLRTRTVTDARGGACQEARSGPMSTDSVMLCVMLDACSRHHAFIRHLHLCTAAGCAVPVGC